MIASPRIRFRPFLTAAAALVVLLSYVHSASADASLLRIFLVIDTNAAKRGGSDNIHRPAQQANLKYMKDVINEVYGSENGKFKDRLYLDVIQGDDVTPEKIRAYFKKLPYNPKQALLFYYGGHGGTDKDKGHYLATSGGNILRSEIKNMMLNTGAQSAFIISDCCSDYVPFGNQPGGGRSLLLNASLLSFAQPSFELAGMPESQQATGGAKANSKLFYDLFYKTEGVVDFTAATKGTVSWCNSNGGYMTRVLAKALADSTNAPSQAVRPDAINWPSFFAKVKERTTATFNDIKSKAAANDPILKATSIQTPEAAQLGGWPTQNRKLLKVKNETSEKIKVYVKYYDLNPTTNQWEWRSATENGKYFIIEPGAEKTLNDNGWLIGGARIRIWAASAQSNLMWSKYRDQDLVLVPQGGYHGPVASHTHKFLP
ncbi:MAG TPA: caspase family protein [Gemmataceae bacterium]|nr:caspase family protein [Gemmataceae bacterium]